MQATGGRPSSGMARATCTRTTTRKASSVRSTRQKPRPGTGTTSRQGTEPRPGTPTGPSGSGPYSPVLTPTTEAVIGPVPGPVIGPVPGPVIGPVRRSRATQVAGLEPSGLGPGPLASARGEFSQDGDFS